MSAIVRNVLPVSDRKYHESDSAYVLPNDAIEHERLDVQAAAITEMLGGSPFRAPLGSKQDVAKAVDVGCGTGIATIQIASLFPKAAKVYGLDISPVPHSTKYLAPANVTFAIGNILNANATHSNDNTLTREIFAANNLDYVFGRMLFLGVNDWATYFSIVSSSLRSGGLVEHQDLDWKFYRTQTNECVSDNWEWHKRVMAANVKSKLSNYAGSGAESHMKAAGLEVLSVRRFEFSFVPTEKAPASQRMGRYVQEKLMPNYPELLRKMLGEGGENLAPEELERLQRHCLRDLSSEEGIHQKYTVTIARKP